MVKGETQHNITLSYLADSTQHSLKQGDVFVGKHLKLIGPSEVFALPWALKWNVVSTIFGIILGGHHLYMYFCVVCDVCLCVRHTCPTVARQIILVLEFQGPTGPQF